MFISERLIPRAILGGVSVRNILMILSSVEIPQVNKERILPKFKAPCWEMMYFCGPTLHYLTCRSGFFRKHTLSLELSVLKSPHQFQEGPVRCSWVKTIPSANGCCCSFSLGRLAMSRIRLPRRCFFAPNFFVIFLWKPWVESSPVHSHLRSLNANSCHHVQRPRDIPALHASL